MKEELKKYLKENLEKSNNRKKFFKNFITRIKDISKNDEFEENEYVLAQNPEDESVYLFRSTEEGELIVPEEAEFDKVTEYYTNVLAED